MIDHSHREAVSIENETSITGARLVRLFEQLQAERGLPETLRVDNGPEFTETDLSLWAGQQGMALEYIKPGKPNQNAFIDREDVLDAWLFLTLDEVRDMTWGWITEYNEARPQDSLGNLNAVEHYQQFVESSTFECST